MYLTEDTILEQRYRIDRLISHGGMGAIYKAFDLKLQIQVAVKENFFRTPQSIKQFEQEVLILARLHHPGLPRVIDHFSFDGQQYLVMDFIEGQNLWEIVKTKNHPLEEKEALEYIIQVCQAVNYLHNYSPPIIHRDIKPQNIKVTPNGKVVLVDFGIAKMIEGDDRTRTGARGVTPGFSPPEQYSGTGTTLASDIYALGATLYAVLTGHKPPDSVSLLVNQAKFIPPNQLNTHLSQQVSQAVLQAMQPQPENRPDSVAVWQKRLGTILNSLSDKEDNEITTILTNIAAFEYLGSAISDTPARNNYWIWAGLALVMVLSLGVAAFFISLNSTDEGIPDAVAFSVVVSRNTPKAAATDETKVTGILDAVVAGSSILPESSTSSTEIVSNARAHQPTDISIVQNTQTNTPFPSSTITTAPPNPTPTFTPVAPTTTPTSLPGVPTLTPTSVSPTKISVSQSDYSVPQLISPIDETNLQQTEIEFVWKWTGDLPPDQGFEVRLWREGDPHYGAFDARETLKWAQILPDNSYKLRINVKETYGLLKQENGIYQWSVAVVQLDPYETIVESKPENVMLNVFEVY